MRKLSFFIIAFMAVSLVSAQDIINTFDGKQIEAVVTEIGVSEVSYRNWNNQNGPVYKILKEEIHTINYRNGFTDTLNEASPVPQTKTIATPAEKPAPQAVQQNLPSPSSPAPSTQPTSPKQQITAILVKGELHDAHGSVLSDYAQRVYLGDMYHDWVKARRMSVTGDVFWILGTCFCVTGIIFASLPEGTLDPSAVWGMAIPGLTFDIIGIPLAVSGRKKMERIYYKRKREQNAAYMTLGPQNFGTGIALRF